MARRRSGGPMRPPRPRQDRGSSAHTGTPGSHTDMSVGISGGGGSGGRSELEAVTVGAVMEKAVADVLHMRESIGFNGVVDVSVELNATQIDQSGWIGVIIGGNDSSQSTTQVKLATRVYLDDQNK